jgi:hypothetical protein
MPAITTRAGKGSALTAQELDDNFGDSWNSITLTSDHVNATTTQTTITDGTRSFTWTPPANSDIEIEGWILVTCAATTNQPSIRAAIPAGMQFGFAEVFYETAAGRSYVQNGFTTTAVNVSVPAGTAAAATPSTIFYKVFIKGKTGASPAAINIQCAAESAAANGCVVKSGSSMRYKVVG